MKSGSMRGWLFTVLSFSRWWWATLTLWWSPDRTASRNRRNWKSYQSTTPEQSDQARSSTSTLTGAESSDAQLEHLSLGGVPVGRMSSEGGRRSQVRQKSTSQLPANWLDINSDTKIWRTDPQYGSALNILTSKPRVNLQRFAPSTSHPAELCFPNPFSQFVIQPNPHLFMSLVLLFRLQYLNR